MLAVTRIWRIAEAFGYLPSVGPARRFASTEATDCGVGLVSVGHGTSSPDQLVELLRLADVISVIDVRSYPGSRRVPHMSRTAMEQWLPDNNIAYRWEPDLGGRRRPLPDSPNTALKNAAFRGYADYMSSDAFRLGRSRVVAEARQRRCAIICAESLWWRCHRRLIADAAVLLDNEPVEHLFHDGRVVGHAALAAARVDGDHLVYDVAP